MFEISNPREVAFLALLCLREGDYIDQFFEERSFKLSDKDLKLAKNIAFGTAKRLLSLEYLVKRLIDVSGFTIFRLKRKEKFLLFTALYQFFFLDKLPFFAIVHETVSIAKKYFGEKKGGFFNKILRLLDKTDISLPDKEEMVQKSDISQLSCYYSYPEFFIKGLIQEYGLDSALKILEVQNLFFRPFVRLSKENTYEHCEVIHNRKFKVAKIIPDKLDYFSKKQGAYIQNITPILILEDLIETFDLKDKEPLTILDLCAAPGGKTLALHEIFPKAVFTINDSSKKRLETLQQNLTLHEVKALVLNCPAEELYFENKFDLIILDVPCSNSGVLGKRPEARWRLNEKNIEELHSLQLKLLEKAGKLLSPSGSIFYMTCSILEYENEKVVEQAVKTNSFHLIKSIKILPDSEGKDGGFGAILQWNKN